MSGKWEYKSSIDCWGNKNCKYSHEKMCDVKFANSVGGIEYERRLTIAVIY